MQKTITVFFIALMLLFSGCAEPDNIVPSPASGKSAWTILVYLDSDNNLEPAAIMDIDEMELAGSNNNVKIVIQWDRIPGYDNSNGDWTGTKRFLVVKDEQEGIIASEEIMDLGEIDMASADSLADFIKWGMQNYPAEKYALFLWNHGGGWAVHTQDETNGTQANIETLKVAFTKAGFAEKKLDLLVFDQCLMS
jgi:clostripain